MNKWTPVEKDALRVFIQNNPKEILKTTSTPKILKGSLHEGRSSEAIYHAWRRMKGLKRKISTAALQGNKSIAPFVVALEAFINEYINKRAVEISRAMAQENEELKALLRKLTKVREAVEEFKL